MVRFYLTERENNDLVYIIFDTVVCQSAVGNSDVVNRVGMKYFRKEREIKIMDDLARIERTYGSVAEYNRLRQEDETEQYEREMRILDNCARNKAKLDSAGERALYFCEDCIGCKYYEMVGPTSPGFGLEDIDDIEHGICHHKAKPFLNVEEPFCSGREEGEYEETNAM